MINRSIQIFSLFLILAFSFAAAIAQEFEMQRQNYITAINDADIILSRADKMIDYRKKAVVGSKAAALLWKHDDEKARAAFMRFWDAINNGPKEQPKSGISDKEEARINLLQRLFPLDSELATKLHKDFNKSQEKDGSLQERLSGSTESARRLAFLSYRVAEEDITLATQILRLGLSEATAPAIPQTLTRIRAKDEILANSIIFLILDELPQKTPTFGLTSLGVTTSYLFPTRPMPTITIEGVRDDERLRSEFMRSGYEVLSRSLLETEEILIREQGFTPQTLSYRKMQQAFIAVTLSAMALRYMPEKTPELALLANGLITSQNAQVVELFKTHVAIIKSMLGELDEKHDTMTAIMAAVAKEDFSKAETLVGDLKQESERKNWIELIYLFKAEALLKRKEGEQSLEAASKITDQGLANRVLPQILKFAHEEEDEPLMVRTFQEIKRVAGKTGKGQRALANFRLVAELASMMKDQSEVMLIESVELINSLSAIDRDKDKSKEDLTPLDIYWNDPDRFLNSSALTRAFTALGRLDMNAALRVADRFNDNNLQMIARLSAMEPTIKKGPPTEPADDN